MTDRWRIQNEDRGLLQRDYQTEKALIRAFHDALATAATEDCAAVLAAYTTPDWHWGGM